MPGLLRLASVAVVATAALAVAAVPANADVEFQALTAATAVHFTLTQEPASSIITASLVDDAAAYAAGTLDTGSVSEAQAASVYPGNLVVQGPSLFCSEVFTCPAQPPSYPLLADASYPRHDHDTAQANQSELGSGPFTTTPAQAVASAGAADNHATSSSSGSSILAGTPVATNVGSGHAFSSLTATGNRLLVHVESTVSNVSVAGLMHIDSVQAVDDIVLVAGRAVSDRPVVTVSGVTVAGQPATIDSGGVHVAGQNGPALGQRLAAAGVTARSIGATRTDTKTAARSDATGLELDFSVPVSHTPYIPNPLPGPFQQIPGVNANGLYVGRLTLGSVGAVGAFQQQPIFDLGGFGTSSSGVTPGSGAPGSAPGSVPAPGAAQGGQLPTGPPLVAAPQTGFLRGLLDALSKDQGEMIYAVIALGTVGLFVGWRGTIAWRRR